MVATAFAGSGGVSSTLKGAVLMLDVRPAPFIAMISALYQMPCWSAPYEEAVGSSGMAPAAAISRLSDVVESNTTPR